MSASRLSRRSCLFPLRFRRGNNEHVNFSSLSGCPPSRATPYVCSQWPVCSCARWHFLFFFFFFFSPTASLLSLVIGRLLMARDCLSNPRPPVFANRSLLLHPQLLQQTLPLHFRGSTARRKALRRRNFNRGNHSRDRDLSIRGRLNFKMAD